MSNGVYDGMMVRSRRLYDPSDLNLCAFVIVNVNYIACILMFHLYKKHLFNS
jgi:hypothetical protein